MSVYKIAVEQTAQTIEHRARYFRNLVITIVFITLTSVISSFASWSFKPLIGLIIVWPACAFFVMMDCRLLNQWQINFFSKWTKQEISLSSFNHMIKAIPQLPPKTTQSMLRMLPILSDGTIENKLSIITREAIAFVFMTAHKMLFNLIAFKTIAYSIASLCVIASIVLHSWLPASFLVILVITYGIEKYIRYFQVKSLKKKIIKFLTYSEFDKLSYNALIKTLDVSQFPVHKCCLQ